MIHPCLWALSTPAPSKKPVYLHHVLTLSWQSLAFTESVFTPDLAETFMRNGYMKCSGGPFAQECCHFFPRDSQHQLESSFQEGACPSLLIKDAPCSYPSIWAAGSSEHTRAQRQAVLSPSCVWFLLSHGTCFGYQSSITVGVWCHWEGQGHGGRPLDFRF